MAHGLNTCFHFPSANWFVGDSGKKSIIDWLSVLDYFGVFLGHPINFYQVPQRSVFSILTDVLPATSKVPLLILFSFKTQIGPNGRTRQMCTHALNDQFDISMQTRSTYL